MKVILCEDVDNLGAMGETVKVRPGYARNFLIPRRLAVAADSVSARQIEHEMRIIRRKEEKRRKELTQVQNALDGVAVTIEAKAGEEGKLFGSVTSLHIAEKLREQGHEVDRKLIVLSEPIKQLGAHTVQIRLAKDIHANIRVTVTPELVEAREELQAD